VFFYSYNNAIEMLLIRCVTKLKPKTEVTTCTR